MRTPYEDENGDKVCVRDFLLGQHESSYAWRWHRSLEYSAGLDEAEAVVEARKRGEKDDLPKPPDVPMHNAAAAIGAAPILEPTIAPAVLTAEPIAPAAVAVADKGTA